MMSRRRFLLTSLAGVIAVPRAAEAQPAGKWRVGFLSAGSSQRGEPTWAAFGTALRDLGYIEGQNLVVDTRFAEGHLDKIPRLAGELVALGPTVVVAVGTAETQALKRATTTIPIVMVVVPDPLDRGLVTSLSRPGGNVTGLTSMPGLELQGKRLELVREIVTAATRIAFLVNPTVPATGARVRAMEAAAQTLGVQLHIIPARTRDELPAAFTAMRRQRLHALLVPTDPLFLIERRRVVDLAGEARIPTMYDVREYVDSGGLAAYGPSFIDLFRRAASYVDRILRGAKAGDLPVEQPSKFELVINLKTAKALGLTIPPSLLLRADQVIE